MATHAPSRVLPLDGTARPKAGIFAGQIRRVYYHVYVACLLGANAVLLVPQSSPGDTGTSQLFIASWLLLAGWTLLLLLTSVRHASRSLGATLAFPVYVLASAIWSIEPSMTIVFGLLLAANIVAAYLMAEELEIGEILTIVARVVVALTVVGLIAYYLGVPQVYHQDHHQRPNILGGIPFRGFFPHKITAGLYAAIGAIAVCARMRGVRRASALAVLGWAALLSGSATALVLFGAGLVAFGAVRAAGKRKVRTSALLIRLAGLVAVGGALAAANWSHLLMMLDRDPTLTGRTILWDWGMSTWLEKPLAGWGFDAYFRSPYAEQIRQAVPVFRNYEIPHFHQAYLQTAVDLGLIGLAMVVGIIVYILVNSYRYALEGEMVVGVAIFSITALIAGAGTVMFVFVTYNHFATFGLFLFAFALRRLRREARGRRVVKRHRTRDLAPRLGPRTESIVARRAMEPVG
ncbi:O-antigen ligase family protein [Xylanimonas sp. McL0601]|uniref:O-antigen ligase family protein n=1 Tax=Xylanimonas sp. McL0601 TaxID=3414739 RepID=UPI003CE6E7E7